MTDVNLNLFRASSNQNGKTLGRNDKRNSVQFLEDSGENLRYIKDCQFNPKTGILSIIKANGDIIEINGFLTQSQLGKGERGARGKIGKPGRNGRKGKEGRPGLEGCEGPEGKPGPAGKAGQDGENGPVGIAGKTGCEGLTGDPGKEGLKGDKGFKGELGRKGIDCIFGPIGPIGPKPRSEAWVGELEPPEDYMIWALPFTGDIPILPVEGALTIIANNIDQTLVQSSGDTYSSVGNIVISDIIELKGNSIITWSGDYTTDSRVNGTISANNKTLMLEANTIITKGQSATITGTITIFVEDTANDSVATRVVNYKFQGSNTQIVPQDLKATAVDRSISEGKNAVFTLNLNQATEKDLLVNLSFSGDTTRLGNSSPVSGLIKIGESSIEFVVATIVQGGVQEDSILKGVFTSSFIREESAGSMTADISVSEQVPATVMKASNKTLRETDTTTLYSVPIVLDGEISTNASVTYTILDGSAKFNTEFTSSAGKTKRLTFTSNYQTLSIPISVIGDNINKGSKSFTIEFSDASSNLDIETSLITITISEDDVSYGGGGGGCLEFGTLVLTPKGLVPCELLAVGDKVISRNIKGMPDGSLNDNFMHWSTNEYIADLAFSRVEKAKLETYHRVVRFNGNERGITSEQPVLIMSNGTVRWKRADEVSYGDMIETVDAWTPVTNIEYITNNVNVIVLDVEPHDVYYADNILVHNVDARALNAKN